MNATEAAVLALERRVEALFKSRSALAIRLAESDRAAAASIELEQKMFADLTDRVETQSLRLSIAHTRLDNARDNIDTLTDRVAELEMAPIILIPTPDGGEWAMSGNSRMECDLDITEKGG